MRNSMLGATAALLRATTANAGGMPEVIMEPEIVEAQTSSSAGGLIVPLLLVLLIAAIAAGSSGGNSVPILLPQT